jgi:ATP-binding cassette subfamily F protein uup
LSHATRNTFHLSVMIVLSLENISKQYDERRLLNGVTLGVRAGERVGIVGVNGSGKSTLLRIAAGIEPPDVGRVSAARDLRVTYLPQNPDIDPTLTVIEQVFRGDAPGMQLLRAYERAAADLAHTPDDDALQAKVGALVEQMDATGAWDLEHAARSILSHLGISELTARVGSLSGGQRKRVAMAAALIAPADLLILDEPTNHIDTETVAWLEAFLSRTTAALLLVTHDRYFLDRVVGRIVEVDGGKLYSYPGAYSRFLEMKAERAIQQAAVEERRQIVLKKELAWLARGARARTTKQQARIDRIDAMQSEVKAVVSSASGESVKEGFAAVNISRRLGKKIIELKGVAKSYDTRTLIDNLSLTIDPRDRLGIIGPNGSGKTTLLNLIAGRLTPDTGAIDVGETVHIAYYDQESAGLDEKQRVIDYVKEGAELARTGSGDTVTAAQMLERFLFPSSMHYSLIGKLSGGERRRLYLLRTLMGAPNVLLLDEPTNDLDIQTLTVLEDYLDDFQGALIAVSHDRYFLDRVAGRLLAFEGDGRVIEHPGAYSYYAEVVAQRRETEARDKPAPRAQPKPTPTATSRPRKLTFKEARELAELEGKISVLETQQADLEAQITAAADNYQELLRLTKELEQTSATLEASIERWADLEEIREQSA